MKTFVLAALLLALPAIAVPRAVHSQTGQNPDAYLCMHLIATDQYLEDLYTEALAELVVGDIDPCLSFTELAASGYQGWCILFAYNIEGISGIEFVIDGWPTGRGAPPHPQIHWEDSATSVLGDPWYPGALASWGLTGGGCDTTGTRVRTGEWWGEDGSHPSPTKIYPFAYFQFDLSNYMTPILLQPETSTHTYPSDPRIYVTDCTVQSVEDEIPNVRTRGCAIGDWGSYCEGCSVRSTTWSAVKATYR